MKILVPTTNGLVGYWSFDEGAGGVAHDFSVNNNHGALVNAPQWVDGIKGKAINLNGSNQYISLGLQSSFDLSGSLSFSFWAKPRLSALTGVHDFICNYDSSGSTCQYEVYLNNGILVFTIDGLGGASFENYTSAASLTANKWHHIVAVSTGQDNVIFYVNGVAYTTTKSGSIATPTSGFGSTSIGRSGDFNGNYFPGSIDEVRIYNRALSQDEITTLYQSGAMKLLTPNSSGLVGYWSFDEGAGTTAHDYSGSGNHGALVNSPQWVDGVKGKCLKFNGSNQYINLFNSLTSETTGSNKKFSICFWLKLLVNTGAQQAIIGKYDTLSSNRSWTTFLNSDRSLSFYTSFDGTASNYRRIDSSAGILPINKWVYISITFDGSILSGDGLDRVKIFISGRNVGTTLGATVGTLGDIFNGNNVLGIGATNILTTPSLFLNGNLDEVRIYNRALQQSEITSLYQSGAEKLLTGTNQGLVGYWSFEENAGTVAHDYSGAGNHGTLVNSPVWTDGIRGKCLKFNGASNYVNCGNPSSLKITGAMTVSFWCKPVLFGATRIIVSKYLTIGNQRGWQVTTQNGGSFNKIEVYLSLDGTSVPNILTGNTSLLPNEWAHVAFSYIPSTILNIYVNGVLDATTSSSIVTSIFDNSADVFIGNRDGLPSNYFSGLIDEVRIYNRALSAKEVMDLYNS